MSATVNPPYGLTAHLTGVSFEDARARVTDALKKEGFGVLTEIDVKATLKTKLDVDFRRYVILGACNPQLAHKSLSADLGIGLLLPCNVCVWEEEGGTAVSAVSPKAMFSVVDNPAVQPIADEVAERLQRVIGSVA